MATQKPTTKQLRRARRRATERDPAAPVAARELATMMDAIKREWPSWFGMGAFKCRRKLSNGAIVRVEITMPALPADSGGTP